LPLGGRRNLDRVHDGKMRAVQTARFSHGDENVSHYGVWGHAQKVCDLFIGFAFRDVKADFPLAPAQRSAGKIFEIRCHDLLPF
jgi:hypothetical protein